MKHVILVEEVFRYIDLGPDSDEPIFGSTKSIIEMEIPFEDLADVDKIIKRRLSRKFNIIKYEAVHNQATPRQISFLLNKCRVSEYYARTRTKQQVSKIISDEIESWHINYDRDWPNPLEDWLEQRYNGGGE